MIVNIAETFPSDPEGLAKCDCPDSCKDSEFVPKISISRFPSKNYLDEKLLPESKCSFIGSV